MENRVSTVYVTSHILTGIFLPSGLPLSSPVYEHVLCFTLLCPPMLRSSLSGFRLSLQSSLLKIQNWPLGAFHYLSSPLSSCALSFLNTHGAKVELSFWLVQEWTLHIFQEQEPITVIRLKFPSWTITHHFISISLVCLSLHIWLRASCGLSPVEINHCSLKWLYRRDAYDYRAP